MTVLERMKLRIPEEPDEAVFLDCIESARAAMLNRRFGSKGTAEQRERFIQEQQDLLCRCAVDLYNKTGAEGQLSHSENGVSRGFESSWISEQLLMEITPLAWVV